ncbi:MAG: HPr family phosphocarrier protein [Gammaproteobacteria bacterium]|nr:HPr family phosphocarrier protein [Gammaproteobacteria bacterium]
MTDGEVVIVNALGLHARAAAKLVNLAKTFTCSIELCVGEKNVDAKSIMKVMMLAAGQGTVLTLRTSGGEEEEAFAAISRLIGDRFGEEQ